MTSADPAQADIPLAAATSPAAPREATRIESLDGLRGIAIILVVIGHYTAGRLPEGLVTDIFSPFAVAGVILFFLLSGFLIEYNLHRNSDAILYAVRRVFRIVPAYWASLVVLIALDRAVLGTHLYSPRDIAANAMLLQDVLRAPLMNGAFWTLLIEWKFYVVAPFAKRAGPLAIRALPYATMAINALVLWRRHESSNLLTYINFCFIGMNYGLWRRGLESTRGLLAVVAVATLTAGAFVMYNRVGMTLFVALNCALLAAALRGRSAVLHHPALIFIGAVSYSWYLYHGGVGYPILAALEGPAIGLSPWLSTTATAAFTLAVAWVSYRFIERPGIALGHRLEQRWAPRPARR